MRPPRARILILDILTLTTALAGGYVWLVSPIHIEFPGVTIRSGSPFRPFAIATILLLFRLSLSATARIWSRVRSVFVSVISKPYVWGPGAILLLSLWPIGRYRAVHDALRGAEEVRASGHAQLALTTRPVLTDAGMQEGVPVPAQAQGATVELACGLPSDAVQFLRPTTAGRACVMSLGSEADPAARQPIARCPLEAGSWHAAEGRLPSPLPPGARLFVGIDAADRTRAEGLAYCARPRPLPRPDASRPNLVIISLDTVRADHLGAYGYARPVSPSIDALSREGTLFERAFAQAPWTTPSHMSLFTSLFPTVHGVDAPGSNRQRRLGDDKRPLAEILRDAGYATAAFTGSGSISAIYGFWRGFDIYAETDHDDPARAGEDISGVYEKASAWLSTHKDLPFFLFFHSYEAHAPFIHETFVHEVAPGDETGRLGALYDGDINYADGFIGKFLGRIAGLGLKERTIIVFLSDHGEELTPRYPGKRLGHGHTVYDELLHVPLIVVAPGRVPAGLRVPQMVQLIDVMPTVLELLGLPAPRGMQGTSFGKVFGGLPIAERTVFAEATSSGPERKTVREGRFQYIKTFERTDPPAHEIPVPIPPEEMFDLLADPEERTSILAHGGADLERLRRHLHAIVELNQSLRGAVPQQEVDEETLRRLRALGYVQ